MYDIENAIDIVAGNEISYALKHDGTVYAWGSNIHSALGIEISL